MGGLGGFFPPLLLGFFRDRAGVIWPAFVLLALTSFALWILNARVFVRRETIAALPRTRGFEQMRAGAWATLWTAFIVAAIVVGSRNLENFDPALVIYTFAVIFATWGVVYHYNVWLDKPPTRMYWDSWMANLPEPWSSTKSRRRSTGSGDSHFRADFHPAPLGAPLVDASVHFLGLHSGDVDHVPIGLRLDFVP